MDQSLFCFCSSKNNSRKIFSAGNHEVCRCENCGQVFVNRKLYNAGSYVYNESDYYVQYNTYLKQKKEFTAHFQRVISIIKKFKASGSLLDIGCGIGLLMEVTKKNGFEVFGIEKSEKAAEYARRNGLNVSTGEIESSQYVFNTFDVIVLNHVLEHMSEPVGILNKIRGLMKEEAILVIGVPNFNSFKSKLKKEKWISLIPEYHIWQFSRETLRHLLELTGFSEIYFEAKDNHKIPWWRIDKIFDNFLNTISVLLDNSESMLVLAKKR